MLHLTGIGDRKKKELKLPQLSFKSSQLLIPTKSSMLEHSSCQG